MLEGARLKNFIYDVLMEIYPTLVKMFYSNLRYVNEVITFEVKKHLFSLFLKKFAEIYNLP